VNGVVTFIDLEDEDDEDNYKKVIQAMAYATLKYDVTQELSERGLLN